MPAWREPEWDEPPTFRGSADFAVSPAIPMSGNPLLILRPADALVFLGRSFGLGMADIAVAMKLSRETTYQALQRARTVLAPLAELKLARAEPRLSRLCVSCGGGRPPGRVRCSSCWEASEKKRAAGRYGATRRWRPSMRTETRTATGTGGRRV
jgi:hypothetical protein